MKIFNHSLFEALPADWQEILNSEKDQAYFQALAQFLIQEWQTQTIFPPQHAIFSAFQATPYAQVKLVLLGQDPYHQAGQAHGLSFSVPPGVKIPPSLRNMFLELKSDLGIAPPTHGNLEAWAKQGILLLNSVLTVRENQAASHQKKGWENFTDAVIAALNLRKTPLVFLLWGGFAKKKARMIDSSKHRVILGVHPSPLSAYGGFFGSRPYSQVNAALVELGQPPIDWAL